MARVLNQRIMLLLKFLIFGTCTEIMQKYVLVFRKYTPKYVVVKGHV